MVDLRSVPGKGKYAVTWTPEAWIEVHFLTAFERRPVMRAAAELAHQAETETRNRKRLRERPEDLPQATWEVRIQGKVRLFYQVLGIVEGVDGQRTVEILRATIKGSETTDQALRRNQ